MNSNHLLLFIGDSITESGRSKENEHLGNGYVRLIRDYFLINSPNKVPTILNKGVGGDKITDLNLRWEEDVMKLNPDYISISIGINDVWRQLDHQEKEQVYPDQFKEIYRRLLARVKDRTKAKLILMEPTIIEEDKNSEGNKKLIPYVEIVQQLAKDFHAILVPTHQAFISYLSSTSEYPLTTDGVHMNSTGNFLIAQTWIKSFKL
ncbi:SGNH/GDSL hydrolase family protein [Priestia aryabhattai]